MASNLKMTRELDPKRPAVLFIPGGMATPPAVFDGIEGEIPWQSAVIDWSRSPGPWDIVELGNRVEELVRELGLERVILAAYSAGGVMALQAAIADEEHRIAGLLLEGETQPTPQHRPLRHRPRGPGSAKADSGAVVFHGTVRAVHFPLLRPPGRSGVKGDNDRICKAGG